ncbi:MAG: PAS domain S-box protein [Bacteroidota bacterium]|nr:PAS domain S-box protein [Bacteroidota bacterium]
MFAQNNRRNIIPFSHFRHVQNETQKITFRRRSADRTLPIDILQLVWDNTSDGMRLTDSDGIIVAVNSAFCSLIRKTESELVGKEFTVMYSSDVDKNKLRTIYMRNLETGSFQKKYEKSFRLHDDTMIEIEITKTELLDEAEERYLLTEFRDISERKRWERNVQESELNYRSLFEQAVMPMYQSSVEGRFVNANSSMLTLLGYASLTELRNINIDTELYCDLKQREDVVGLMRTNGEIKGKELQLKKKDGSIIHVLLYSRAITVDSGTLTGFEGTLEDITFRKETEEKISKYVDALESMQKELTKLNVQKDKIIAVISHDLRSPLSSILGFCDLLKEEFTTLSDKEKMEFIDYIKESAEQQLSLVNSMLDWSRIETGRIALTFENIDLKNIGNEVIHSLLGLAKKKQIYLENNIPNGSIVNGDVKLLRQVFSNLIGNALKFTPANGVITLSREIETDGTHSICVSDTGVGIPQGELQRLFKIEEKYSRNGLDGEIGTGLGLPLCLEIMKKHGGTITVKSEIGEGTTFALKFPQPVRAGSSRVLIVDDQKGNRLLLSKFISRILSGTEILFAENGEEAEAIAIAKKPTLIFTDYHMPAMNGIDFLRKMRNNSVTKNIPVIIVSGDDIDNQIQYDALTTGLRKPIIFKKLEETVKGLVH